MTDALLLLWVLAIDAALSLDNAAVIALVAQQVPEEDRQLVTLGGIGVAVILRIVCAFCAATILKFAVFSVLGGVYLVMLSWKLLEAKKPDMPDVPEKSFGAAMVTIGLADLAMSLDNVIAVAGAAKNSPAIVILGITCSIVMMFIAATSIRSALERWPYTVWCAAGLVFLTGVKLIADGLFAIV